MIFEEMENTLEYYGDLLDFLSDNVPCWDTLIEMFNEQRDTK